MPHWEKKFLNAQFFEGHRIIIIYYDDERFSFLFVTLDVVSKKSTHIKWLLKLIPLLPVKSLQKFNVDSILTSLSQ